MGLIKLRVKHRIKIKITLLILLFSLTSLAQVKASGLSKSINKTEIHGEFHAVNHFRADGVNDDYSPTIDYRLESHTPIHNFRGYQGKVVTRVEGIGFIDNRVDDFFSDDLINLEELFYQTSKYFNDGGLKMDFIFGKFANRRFFDKPEIVPDGFDIGERATPIAFPNSLLNGINGSRGSNGRRSTVDTFGFESPGSYGFNFALKDQAGDGFFDRWGFQQAIAVIKLDNFDSNLYGISELNKDWVWNDKDGQLWESNHHLHRLL